MNQEIDRICRNLSQIQESIVNEYFVAIEWDQQQYQQVVDGLMIVLNSEFTCKIADKIYNLKKQISSVKQSNNKLQQYIQTEQNNQERQIDTLQRQLLQKQEIIEQIKLVIMDEYVEDSNMAQLMRLQVDKYKSTHKQLCEVRKNNHLISAELNYLNEKNQRLESDMGKLQQLAERCAQQFQRKQNNSSQVLSTVSELHRERETYVSANQCMKVTKSILQKQLQINLQNINNLNIEIDSLEMQIKTLNIKNNQSQLQICHLTTLNQQLRFQIEQSAARNKQIEQFMKINRCLVQQLKQKQKIVDQLKVTIQQFQLDNKSKDCAFDQERELLEKKIDCLTKQLARKTNEDIDRECRKLTQQYKQLQNNLLSQLQSVNSQLYHVTMQKSQQDIRTKQVILDHQLCISELQRQIQYLSQPSEFQLRLQHKLQLTLRKIWTLQFEIKNLAACLKTIKTLIVREMEILKRETSEQIKLVYKQTLLSHLKASQLNQTSTQLSTKFEPCLTCNSRTNQPITDKSIKNLMTKMQLLSQSNMKFVNKHSGKKYK